MMPARALKTTPETIGRKRLRPQNSAAGVPITANILTNYGLSREVFARDAPCDVQGSSGAQRVAFPAVTAAQT